jgi:hypothetical protein
MAGLSDQVEDKDLPVSWTHPIGTRDGTLTADAKMVNCFAEQIENGFVLIKRPGTSYYSGILGTAQGQFSYFGANFFIVNNTAYASATLSGAGIAIPSALTPFEPFVSLSSEEAGAPLTVIQDQAGNLWTFNGLAFTKVTDANYTGTTVAQGIAYLDGVYYAMRVDGQVIGSAINDPTTWPALDFVQADVTYNAGVTVLRHLNYIIGFYNAGTQVFWDANAAPNGSGIALQPVLNASFTTGCFNGATVVELYDVSYWVATTAQFGRTIQTFQGLSMVKISTPFIDKILNQPTLTNLSTMWAFGFQISGHIFYVLTIPVLNVTLAYDVNTQNWSTWSSVVGGVEQYFTGRFYQNEQGQSSGVIGDSLMDTSTGKQMVMLPSTYVDATGPINVTSISPPYDWNTSNYKRFNYISQLGDFINTMVNISFSDDDYQSFSTPRAMQLVGPRNQLRGGGSSRRRAWKLTHQDNTPLRIGELRLDLDIMAR